VLFSPGDDVFGQFLPDAGHMGEQRRGRAVEVNADAVDAVFHDAGERLPKPLLVDVLLVLSDADAFRIDFHKLRQRILQSPADGNCAAHVDIEFREFARADF